MKNDLIKYGAGIFIGFASTLVLSQHVYLPGSHIPESATNCFPSAQIIPPSSSQPSSSSSLDKYLPLLTTPTIHTSLDLDSEGNITKTIDRNTLASSSTSALDDLLSDYKITPTGVEYTKEGTAKDLQQLVNRKIIYVHEGRKEIYPQLAGNENQFLPLEEILRKKMGDCKDGFIVMANLLAQEGYTVQGLQVNPHNGKPGHIVVVYQDPETKLYGTAGIRNDDFNLPIYSDLETLAKHQALKQSWNTATAQTVDITAAIQSGTARNGNTPFTLPTTLLADIDLEKEYGISFSEREDNKGKIDFKMDKGGYEINYDGLILGKTPALNGMMIKSVYISVDKGEAYMHLTVKENDRFSYMLTAFLGSSQMKLSSFDKFDRAKVTDNITDVKVSKKQKKDLEQYLTKMMAGFASPVHTAWKQKYRAAAIQQKQ